MLSADFARLGEEVRAVVGAGTADYRRIIEIMRGELGDAQQERAAS